MLQTIAGITAKTLPKNPQFFGLDLNCAIYHCVKKIQTKTPYQEDIQLKWEQDLIDSVVAYIKQMHKIVNPSQMMYIAVDGVAPMAKIKQQRMRRFKSSVLAEEEGVVRAQAKGVAYVKQPRWDTNAITPGTKFMDKLTTSLRAYGKTKPKSIVVSSSDEAGEGEQKIMEYLRKHKYTETVVYGLDADLIVLSLYANAKQGIQVDLFREEVEMNGQVKSNPDGEESFLYMKCDVLADALFSMYSKPSQSKQDFLIDFVALMSILGNDFVPHGMSLKIRDEGIEKLLNIYKSDITKPLLQQNNYNKDALIEMFRAIHEREPQWILKGIRSKLTSRFFCNSKDLADIALAKLNDQPVQWAEERCLVNILEQENMKPQYQLKDEWRTVYDKEALGGSNPADAAKVYVEALCWTFAYYRGEQVDMHWFYPWHLPPRCETVLKWLESNQTLPIPSLKRDQIKPLEQLAMVLPQSSFHLLPTEFSQLPTQYPYAWPTKWPLFSLGRRFLWECEPLIPLIKPNQIKQWIEVMYES